MVRAACAQRGDEFRQPPDDPGAGYGIAVVARVRDLAVPDRQDHEEAQRERLGGLGELAVQLVLHDDHLGVGGLVDDGLAQPLVSPARRSGPQPRAQFLAAGLAMRSTVPRGLPGAVAAEAAFAVGQQLLVLECG